MPGHNHRKPPARIQIEHPSPVVDCGRYPARSTVGERVAVAADIFKDGHDVLRAVVRWRGLDSDGRSWQEAPLRPVDAEIQGVRLGGSFPVDTPGRWVWTIEAWTDALASWRLELTRKVAAGQDDLDSELAEGALLLRAAAKRAEGADRSTITAATDAVDATATPAATRVAAALADGAVAAPTATPTASGPPRWPDPSRSTSTASVAQVTTRWLVSIRR